MLHFGDFPPPKRRGLFVHAVLIALLSTVTAIGFFSLTRAPVGPVFLAALLLALLALVPIPVLGYRAYALSRAKYVFTRNNLALNWGLRVEEIPLNDIEWMRPAGDLARPLRLPPLALPGGVIGARRHPDLGAVEFLASDPERLLLVATARRVFVISPDNPVLLMQTFARATEMGSLAEAPAKSVYPSFIIAEAWSRALVRFLWLTSMFLNLGLFVWVSLLIPGIHRIALGAQPGTGTAEAVASTQLILVPVSSLVLVVAGWLAGLYFYRWEKERPLAFIVWASGAVTSLLFLIAVLFIVTTPV